MLVLKRKRNEKITIDGDIEITVVDIGRNAVRLGITAPQERGISRPDCRNVPAVPSMDEGVTEAA